jgi:hypothetical protein
MASFHPDLNLPVRQACRKYNEAPQ